MGSCVSPTQPAPGPQPVSQMLDVHVCSWLFRLKAKAPVACWGRARSQGQRSRGPVFWQNKVDPAIHHQCLIRGCFQSSLSQLCPCCLILSMGWWKMTMDQPLIRGLHLCPSVGLPPESGSVSDLKLTHLSPICHSLLGQEAHLGRGHALNGVQIIPVCAES